MNRKSVLLGLGMVLFLAGLGGGIVFLVRWEPDFYRKLALPPGQERKERSHEFMARLGELVQSIGQDIKWYDTFSAEQINSYFAEDFAKSGPPLPEGISEPRIAIDNDKVRLAFRYGSGRWSTVISIDLGVWLAPKEYNVVALELQGMHAGRLPISAQSLLESVSEVARQQKIEVTWYRHKGNPVALLRFQGDRPTPTTRLKRLELRPGTITLYGQAVEDVPSQASQ